MMRIVCRRESLLARFQMAAACAPGRSPKPVLQNVKLEAGPEGVLLVGADLEVGMRVQVEGVEVERPGQALLPVDRMGSLLKESREEQFTIEADERGVRVVGSRSTFQLPSGDPQEFPAFGAPQGDRCCVLPAALLKTLVRRTSFSTDPESTRYALGGVLFEFEPERVIAVATDGRRLAKMSGAVPAGGSWPAGHVIVPTRSLQLLERFLPDEGEVKLTPQASACFFEWSGATLSTRLVEGRFPRWRDVIPQPSRASLVELPAGPLFAAVRQGAIVADPETRGIDFHFADGALVVEGQTAERGESRVETPIPYDGRPVAVRLDFRFVLDFLRVLDPTQTVTLELAGPDSPALFTTEDGYAYVVMSLARDAAAA